MTERLLWTRSYPRDIRIRHPERLGNLSNRQRYSEKVKRVPGPPQKAGRKHEPLVGRQLAQNSDGVSQLVLEKQKG